ncbi:MAG TPA: hypothetical protein VJ600_01160 [Holophagaceae bacterium]|nr:hypothetical protein [Holophagaceae bacterium]
MRRTALLPLLALALASGQALQAQQPHLGFTIDLIQPTGDFDSKTYPPTTNVLTPQTESYDVGLGAAFTVSFPLERAVAIRMNLNFNSNDGKNTAPGYATLDIRHTMFNVGGDIQIFPGQGAFRHRGFYFLGGISADFETFEQRDPSYNYYYYYDNYYTTDRKSRMGGQIGFGHSFGGDAGARFTLELLYHTSLSAHDTNAGDPPATSYVKAGFGWVF